MQNNKCKIFENISNISSLILFLFWKIFTTESSLNDLVKTVSPKTKSNGQSDTNVCSWKLSKKQHYPNKHAFCLPFSTHYLSPIMRNQKFSESLQHGLILFSTVRKNNFPNFLKNVSCFRAFCFDLASCSRVLVVNMKQKMWFDCILVDF